jgi:hypothetical protein
MGPAKGKPRKIGTFGVVGDMPQSPPFEAASREDAMAAKRGSRKAGGRQKAAQVRDLTDRSGRGAKGGAKGEAYTMQTMSSSVIQVMHDLGDALKTAASKG